MLPVKLKPYPLLEVQNTQFHSAPNMGHICYREGKLLMCGCRNCVMEKTNRWKICAMWNALVDTISYWYIHRWLEHSDSEKNIPIRFSETNRFFFDSIPFSTSLPYRRIGYYRLLCCQMSTLLRHHESLSQLHKDSKTNQ